jgi:hypothetical protein
MPKRLAVLWILFAAVMGFAVGGSVVSSQPSQFPEHNQTADQPEKKINGNREEKPIWKPNDPVSAYTFVLAIFTGLLVLVSAVQIRFLIRAEGIAKSNADAALLNAKAVMSAEGAVIYPIIKFDNLKMRITSMGGVDREEMLGPFVNYCFKNYGKTPATLESVMHGMDYFEKPSKLRTMHAVDDRPLEIIGPGDEGGEFRVNLPRVFTEEMRQAVEEYRSDLLLFGEARFTDFFNRKFRCIWECDGRAGGFKLIRHEQYEDPDAKSA